MKKCFILISAIFLFSVSISAQTDFEKPFEWKSLSPENEEFSVEAPDNLMLYSYDVKNENRRYSGQVGGTYFFIFSDSLKEDFQFRSAIKFIETIQKAEVEKQANSKEMKFSFSEDEDFFHTVYAVKTKNRAYIFHLVSAKKDDSNVDRFFKSLKINQKSAPIEAKKTTEIPEQNKNSEQQKTISGTGGQGSGRGSGAGDGIGNGEGSGVGNGSGRGSGVGNGTGSGLQINKNKTSENKDLYITSKPKPRYTDSARFYEITGNVRTRVTFLKDGTIGSVIPITKLPFGLTNSAIQAAKQMRFGAKIENGQPVSITKVVVFNFTIY